VALTFWVFPKVVDRDANFGGSGSWYAPPSSECIDAELIQKRGTGGFVNVDRCHGTSAGVYVQDENA
jgi:hypothetical protein